MKKTGIFFFSIIPVFLALGIEFMVQFFAMGLSGLGLGMGVQGLSTYSDFINMMNTDDFSIMTMVLYSITIILLFGMWYYSWFQGDLLPHPAENFHWSKLVGILIMVPFAQYAASYIVGFTAVAFPPALDAYNELMETAGLTDGLSIWAVLYAIILGPICEELIFRGITMKSIRRIFGFWAANLFQAFIFGCYHMNLIQGVYAFALGLLLGYVCEKGGSIYYSILLHICFNFFGTVLVDYIPYPSSTFGNALLFFGTIAALVIAVKLFEFGRKKL